MIPPEYKGSHPRMSMITEIGPFVNANFRFYTPYTELYGSSVLIILMVFDVLFILHF